MGRKLVRDYLTENYKSTVFLDAKEQRVHYAATWITQYTNGVQPDDGVNS